MIFFLVLLIAVGQPYADVFTWWRNATTHAMVAWAWAHLGLQVSTAHALSPALHGNHEAGHRSRLHASCNPFGWLQDESPHPRLSVQLLKLPSTSQMHPTSTTPCCCTDLRMPHLLMTAGDYPHSPSWGCNP